MANILNYDNNVTYYNDEEVSDKQMLVDNSSITQEDEVSMITFAKQATVYAKKAKKKKMYDWKTKNKSFLDLYNDLYKLGIKNNKFFLVLYDSSLQGVDVYSKHLPKETQLKIFIECMINPWYFLREVLRIPTDGTPIEVGGGVQYQIDRNNAAGWYLFLNAIDHYRSKARQTGKTQDVVGQFNYAYHFGNLSSAMQFFNKDQEQANLNLYRLKCQRDMMPPWLQMRMITDEAGKNNKGVDNTKSIRNPVTGNSIQTMPKATSKESAMKIGRGGTTPLQNYDEFDFIPFQTEIMGAASFAFATASRAAKKHFSLTARIISSTPGDLDTRDGAAAAKFVSRMLIWDDKFYDEDINKIKKLLASPAYNGFVYVEHSWKQLKKSMLWYEEQCKFVDYDQEKIMREIDLKRIHGSSRSPFPRSTILALIANQREPIESIDYSKNLCPINFYERMKKNVPYILTVDPAEGLAANCTAMVLINPFTQMVAAEFKSPYISQPDMSKLIVKLMDDRCPNAMIIIENNRGRELINCLLETKYRYNLYYDDGKLQEKKVDKLDVRGRLKQEAMIRRAYGHTTSSNRSQYFAILENLTEERRELLVSQYIVSDICGLVRNATGKIVAGNKANNEDYSGDDAIMAYLIGMYIYLFAPAEKLAEFNIRRGATDVSDEYDEDGNLSEIGTLKQLKNLMGSLPESMREIVQSGLARIDPSMKTETYAEQLRKSASATGSSNMSYTDSKETHPITETGFWDEYDNKVVESNDFYGMNSYDPYSSGINDYGDNSSSSSYDIMSDLIGRN